MSELKCSFCDFKAVYVGAGKFFCSYHAAMYYLTRAHPEEQVQKQVVE